MKSVEPSRTDRRLSSAQPARAPRPFLFLSFSLNVGLLLFLALVGRRPAELPATPSARATGRILRTETKRVSTRPAHALPWQQLQSGDLAVYAANLRAADCPEKTVRDILLPLIEEKFKHLESPVSESTNFWASFSQRQVAAIARAEQKSALRQQQDKTVKELLGFVWTPEGLKNAYEGEAACSLGFLDYERAEKFLCIADRFKKQFSGGNISRRTDRRSAIYNAWRQEVGEVLSLSEFEETELRAILTACQRRNPNLCRAGLNGSELRQLMSYRRELCNPLPSALLAEDSTLLQELDRAGEQQFNAKTRSLLGDSRFIDYLKNCDVSIERTLAALESVHLPRTLTLQLFDLREDALARAQEIRQLPTRRAEKRLRLAALRQNSIEQLAALSNATTDSPLFNINHEWLQQIANP